MVKQLQIRTSWNSSAATAYARSMPDRRWHGSEGILLPQPPAVPNCGPRRRCRIRDRSASSAMRMPHGRLAGLLRAARSKGHSACSSSLLGRGCPGSDRLPQRGCKNLASTYTQQLFTRQPTPAARALTYSIIALERPGRRDVDSAREALGHATSMISQNLSAARVGQLHDWLIPQLLSREARQLLDGDNETDKIDKTEDKWSQNNVRATFAWFADRRSALHFPVAGVSTPAGAALADRPNIVSYDQGYGDASCYWQTDLKTPVVERSPGQAYASHSPGRQAGDNLHCPPDITGKFSSSGTWGAFPAKDESRQ